MNDIKASVRTGPNTVQTSYNLTCHPTDASIYPLQAADGASIVVLGHNDGLSIVKAYTKGALNEEGHDEVASASDAESLSTRAKPWLNIQLDSAVQRIAFPPIASQTKQSTIPHHLQSHASIAVACADSTIRLISFKIDTGPRDDGQIEGDGTKITKVHAGQYHQDLIACLALTWTVNEISEEQVKSRSRSRGRNKVSDESKPAYAFLLASSSISASGLLTVHRVTFARHFDNHGHSPVLITKHFTRLPLLKSSIHFSPSSNPSPDHTKLLLTSPAHGIARSYDVAMHTASLKRRRTLEIEDEESSAIPSAVACLTLHTPFRSSGAVPSRSKILDAVWIEHGQAVLALLEDGTWGKWDVACAQTTQRQEFLSNQSPVALTLFRTHGSIAPTLHKAKSSKTKSSSTFAPVTPHTRKTPSTALFASTDQRDGIVSPSGASGRIVVSGSNVAGSTTSETVIFSYDGMNSFIPSVQSTRPSRELGGTTTETKTQPLPSVYLGGEKQRAIALPQTRAKQSNGLFKNLAATTQMIVVSNSRLILLHKPEPRSIGKTISLDLPLRSSRSNNTTLLSRAGNNQMLDLDAMDKMLANMDNTDITATLSSGAQNIAAAVAEDTAPIDLETGSPSRSTTSKLRVDPTALNGRRKLFR